MEGAKPCEVRTVFFKLNVTTDQFDEVDSVEQIGDETLGNQRARLDRDEKPKPLHTHVVMGQVSALGALLRQRGLD